MALFKIFRGTSENLPNKIHDGYAYFTTDDGKFYIDTFNQRILVNPDTSSADKIAYLKDGVMTDVGTVLDQILGSSASFEIHTSEEWVDAGRNISQAGVLYIYSDSYELQDGTKIPRIKIGDGLAYISDLPFFDEKLRLDLVQHIDNFDVHVTLEEKRAWWNKLNVNDSQEVLDGALILNRS